MKKLLSLTLVLSFHSSLALSQEESTQTPAPADAKTTESAGADSQEAVCKQGEKVRRVVLDSSQAACVVKYFKDTETPGVETKLWTYANERETCKNRYSGFVDKLKGLGWNCG